MWRFVLTRLALVVPTFLGMTLLAFFLIRLVPGDPIETLAGERGIDPARHAALMKDYGLDRPLMVQYGLYLGRLLHGDLGKSMNSETTGVCVIIDLPRSPCSRRPRYRPYWTISGRSRP